jgi:hypothetical protein
MKAKQKADMSLAVDRCDDGMSEIHDRPVLVPAGSVPRLRVELCGSPADLVVTLASEVVFHQEVVDTFFAPLPVPSDPRGELLVWSLVPTADTWRLQTEVSVDSGIAFRMRKTSDSQRKHPKFAVLLRSL